LTEGDKEEVVNEIFSAVSGLFAGLPLPFFACVWLTGEAVRVFGIRDAQMGLAEFALRVLPTVEGRISPRVL